MKLLQCDQCKNQIEDDDSTPMMDGWIVLSQYNIHYNFCSAACLAVRLKETQE